MKHINWALRKSPQQNEQWLKAPVVHKWVLRTKGNLTRASPLDTRLIKNYQYSSIAGLEDKAEGTVYFQVYIYNIQIAVC